MSEHEGKEIVILFGQNACATIVEIFLPTVNLGHIDEGLMPSLGKWLLDKESGDALA